MSKVSFFESILSTSPKVSKDVSYFLERIRNGASKDLIADLRSTADEEKQQVIKKKLPVVCFNGYFNNRSKAGLKKSSGLLTLDFDDCKGLDSANELKEKLKKDHHVFSCWISPRLGVKALYRIIDVDDDSHLKQVFEQVKESYPDLDDSGKDISRACFESYDPEIYINLDAEIFVPEVRILPHEEIEIGQVTNIPLIDGDVISNRLIKWFQNKYDSSQRNNSIFKLASAFNDFGVDKTTALSYCLNYAEKDFKANEIKKILDSAYKKTSQFGTKFFEDKERKKRLKHMVVSGAKNKDLKKEFSDLSDEALNKEITIIKESVDLDKFWEYDFEGKLKINPYLYKVYLENLNYYKYYPVGQSDAFVFITKKENFLNNTNEFQIKDNIMKNLLYKNEVDVFNLVAERTKLFSINYLSMINTADVESKKDGKDFAMLYYQNIALKVFKDKIEEITYDELDGFVWEDQIIKRDYKKTDHHKSMFRSFLWYTSGQNIDRYNTLKSVIGYLLHSHKTSANNKAIILNDEVISDNPNGGSGKGIFTNAISHMKKVSTIDGKTFDFNKSFAYQTVPTDCQVLAFDDVKKNFNFESLFSIITEGITIEYKGKDAVKLPVQDSPKVLISTNYTIKAEGGSFERRMFEVEFSSYFGAHHSPLDEFGCLLFDEWEDLEWSRFDQYMINCLQYYLQNGLVESELKNLALRKLINKTSREFIEWMNEKTFNNNQRIDYKQWLDQFKNEFEDFQKWLNQRTFNNWLKAYFEFKNIEVESISSNGLRMYELKIKDEEQNNQDEDLDIWDELENDLGL